MKKTKLLFLIFLFPISLIAQERILVRGKVVDGETGDPLPGVNVVVDKTTSGVTTDLDGTFEIRVLPTDRLVFSFLGMETLIVEV